jgi:hypothetical protein
MWGMRSTLDAGDAVKNRCGGRGRYEMRGTRSMRYEADCFSG